MTDDIMKNLEAMNRRTLKATRELIDLNGKLMNRILQNQMELANLYIEGGERQLEAGQQSSDPGEYQKNQAAIMEEYSRKLAKVTEDNISLARQAGEELQNWFASNLTGKPDAGK